jgi:alcohol dehydrogenase
MTLVSDNLLAAYRDGADAGARENMMLGSLLAGIAFSNSSVALVHGMSRPLGVRFHVPHGLSNALLFPEVTRFSLDGAPERYADCARALGLPVGDDPALAGAVLADELASLVRALDVPTLAELGVAPDAWREAIPTMARQALDSGSPANNPIVPTHDEIAALYERVYVGR